MAGILEDYAKRGVFRGFSRGPVHRGKAAFKMLWHRDRFFELILDTKRRTFRFPVVLPGVPRNSSMYREFKQFLDSAHSRTVPAHRWIDRKKARVRSSHRNGNVALTVTVVNSDYEYSVRKLVHLVHEIYLVFLSDGRYYKYLVETFDLDPDRL